MYRVGDILIGIAPRGEYYITSKDCVVKVVKVYDSREIEVEVLKSGCEVPNSDRERYIGQSYSVQSMHFIPYARNKGKEEDKSYV